VLRAWGRGVEGSTHYEPRSSAVGNLTIGRATRRVRVGAERLAVTPTEYRLISTLAERPDEAVSRKELSVRVWGYEDASNGRTIDVRIRRLRAKLVGKPRPPVILTVRGLGYKLTLTR
jgi:two-component system, OmpR family, response regulator MtrA